MHHSEEMNVLEFTSTATETMQRCNENRFMCVSDVSVCECECENDLWEILLTLHISDCISAFAFGSQPCLLCNGY